MEAKEFEQLRSDVNHLLTCIDLAEEEGPLRWATNLRTVARVASSISATAKAFENLERKMNWRPAGSAVKQRREPATIDAAAREAEGETERGDDD